jgi:hypothetical protein
LTPCTLYTVSILLDISREHLLTSESAGMISGGYLIWYLSQNECLASLRSASSNMPSKSAVSTFDLSVSFNDACCLIACHAALSRAVISSASGMLSAVERKVATSLSLAERT